MVLKLKLALNSTFISVILGLQVYTTIISHTIFTTTQQLETYFISEISQYTSISRHIPCVSQDGIHTLKCSVGDTPQMETIG